MTLYSKILLKTTYTNPQLVNPKINTAIQFGGEESANNTETGPNNQASLNAPTVQAVPSDDIFAFLDAQASYKTEMIKIKGIDKNTVSNLREQLAESNLLKDDLLAMGFTEEEISKYFISTQPRIENENGEYVLPEGQVDTFKLNSGIEINGRAVNSIDDLKYELFEAPIELLMHKVRAGVIAQDKIVSELQKLGATNVQEKPIENDPLNRRIITYTYRGITSDFIAENLTVVEEPKTEYDANGEAFVEVMETRVYSREALRSFGLTDSDMAQYFDKKSIEDVKNEGKFGEKKAAQANSKDGYCYQLKSGIVINGHEVKNIHDLYYFIVLQNLK